MNQVHPGAKLIIFAKATAKVEAAADLRISGIVHANAGGRYIIRTFRFEVDHPADAAAGDAIEQTVSPFEDFNALQHLGIHHLTRHHARQAAHGHIIAIQLKPANAIGFGKVTVALHRLYAGVITDHLGDSLRLLVLNQFRGIADNAKRHIHRLLFAKHTDTAAVGNLSVKEGRYHQVAAGFKIAAFGRLNEHNLFVFVAIRGVVCSYSALGNGANG